MKFDIKKIPFCSYGGTLVISYIENCKGIKDGLYIRNIQGGDNFVSHVFRIELIDEGELIPFKAIATPTLLKLECLKGFIKLCISEKNIIRIHGKGVSLRLTMDTNAYDNAIPVRKGQWEVNSYTEQIKFMFTAIKGDFIVNAPWTICKSNHVIADFTCDNESSEFDAAIEAYETVWEEKEYKTFDYYHEAIKESYEKWIKGLPLAPEEMKIGRELAGYITWSCVVNPKGNLTRRAIYMSKNFMPNIWSWDNCFNAMALIRRYPELAWDQLMIFIDNQDKSGLFADYINDKCISWSCTKPPIHGWVLRWMMNRSDFFTKERIKEIYEPLVKWTDWWFKYRDYNKNGIPSYNHGNDSGWDNSTVFNELPPIESPDLLSYLIIQMDVLSELAISIGKSEESKHWEKRADELLDKLIKHFYINNKFVARYSGSNKVCESNSLLLYMPIVLGNRLPKVVTKNLVERLKRRNKFCTEYGLATEKIDSQYYKSDGYWRGPIWAPTTMLLVDGLYNIGETKFAEDIAFKFCSMVSKSGMAENYNSLTGEALGENAFTMTSSVFLVLLQEFYNISARHQS